MKLLILLMIVVVVFLGLNYRQLYSAWTIKSEARRLVKAVAEAPMEVITPEHMEDNFDSKLSTDFWKFSTINGAGKVSPDSIQ